MDIFKEKEHKLLFFLKVAWLPVVYQIAWRRKGWEKINQGLQKGFPLQLRWIWGSWSLWPCPELLLLHKTSSTLSPWPVWALEVTLLQHEDTIQTTPFSSDPFCSLSSLTTVPDPTWRQWAPRAMFLLWDSGHGHQGQTTDQSWITHIFSSRNLELGLKSAPVRFS